MADIADRIVLGKVFTADDSRPYAEGFAVKDGKIVLVGTKDEELALKGAGTEVKEYAEGLITPGFTEGHAHVTQTMELIVGPLTNGDTIEKVQKQLRDYADAHPGTGPIQGTGFDPALFGLSGPDRKYIDEVIPDRPVVVYDDGHHSVWVNTKALQVAGITKDTLDPANGHIVKDPVTGEPTGFLQELAAGLAKPAQPATTPEIYAQAIEKYQGIGLRYGITNAFEPMLSYTEDEEKANAGYRLLEKSGKLKINFRVAQTFLPKHSPEAFFARQDALHEEFQGHPKLQYNTVKFFMDGVVDGHTALLREPYCTDPKDCGPWNYSQEELNERVKLSLQKGYRTHFHAIGDAAIDEAINACEYGQKDLGGSGYRNQITHLQVCRPDQPARMADLGLIAVTNPYWHYKTELYEPLELPNLGVERAEHMYYMKSFLDAGVRLTTASDFPVTIPPDTMYCLHMMVNRFDPKTSQEAYFPEECIGVEDALKALTIQGAYQLDMEDTHGSITAGKQADYVVLSQDVISIDPMQIYKTHVLETVIDGETLYTYQPE